MGVITFKENASGTIKINAVFGKDKKTRTKIGFKVKIKK